MRLYRVVPERREPPKGKKLGNQQGESSRQKKSMYKGPEAREPGRFVDIPTGLAADIKKCA